MGKCDIIGQMCHLWANVTFLGKYAHLWANVTLLGKCDIYGQMRHYWANVLLGRLLNSNQSYFYAPNYVTITLDLSIYKKVYVLFEKVP